MIPDEEPETQNQKRKVRETPSVKQTSKNGSRKSSSERVEREIQGKFNSPGVFIDDEKTDETQKGDEVTSDDEDDDIVVNVEEEGPAGKFSVFPYNQRREHILTRNFLTRFF